MSDNTLFDTYIMVDWSAKDEPGPQNRKEDKLKKDNIWIGQADRGDKGLSYSQTYCRTRNRAYLHLEAILQQLLKDKKRVLVGFDFAFGYPEGFAELLTGKADWKPVWQYLADNLKDDELNENNRFEMAGQANGKCKEEGPFWGLAKGIEAEGIGPKSPWKGVEELTYNGKTIRRLRHTDARTPGTQEVWKLYGAGSVGSQALTGIPVVWKLRNHKGLEKDSYIWPFETMMLEKEVLEKKGKVVFAEIFPSLATDKIKELGRDKENNASKPKDQLQVWAMTEMLGAADNSGELMNWFVEAAALPKVIRSEEAAILQPPPGLEEEPKKKEPKAKKTEKRARPEKKEKKAKKEKKKPTMDPAARAREVEKARNEKKKKQEEARKEREKKKEETRKKREEANAKRKEQRDQDKAKMREEREKERAAKLKEREEKQAKKLQEREAAKAEKEKEREEKKAAEKAKREEAKKARLAEVETKRNEKAALAEQEKRRREEKEKAVQAEREAAKQKAEEEKKMKAAGSLKAQYERSKKDEQPAEKSSETITAGPAKDAPEKPAAEPEKAPEKPADDSAGEEPKA